MKKKKYMERFSLIMDILLCSYAPSSPSLRKTGTDFLRCTPPGEEQTEMEGLTSGVLCAALADV
jgi:hypothetical protein